jgi:hypothetical protein
MDAESKGPHSVGRFNPLVGAIQSGMLPPHSNGWMGNHPASPHLTVSRSSSSRFGGQTVHSGAPAGLTMQQQAVLHQMHLRRGSVGPRSFVSARSGGVQSQAHVVNMRQHQPGFVPSIHLPYGTVNPAYPGSPSPPQYHRQQAQHQQQMVAQNRATWTPNPAVLRRMSTSPTGGNVPRLSTPTRM